MRQINQRWRGNNPRCARQIDICDLKALKEAFSRNISLIQWLHLAEIMSIFGWAADLFKQYCWVPIRYWFRCAPLDELKNDLSVPYSTDECRVYRFLIPAFTRWSIIGSLPPQAASDHLGSIALMVCQWLSWFNNYRGLSAWKTSLMTSNALLESLCQFIVIGQQIVLVICGRSCPALYLV